MKKIELESILNFSDYKSLIYFNFVFKNKLAKPIFILTLTICVVSILTPVITSSKFGILSYLSSLYLFFIAIFYITLELRMKKFSKESDSLIGKKQRIIIRNNGIKVSNLIKPKGENYAWNLVNQIYELKKYFYIYINNGVVLVIEKSVLSENDKKYMCQFFKDKVKENYIKRC